ncbi:hypothetical protein TFKS16_2691 [Tannerella forsythia KS16]|uniref:Uncharacterized protein n=1 Tax=Tannerella forsythia (strain ATCC 43037 / JCM 10827 / CCUG 21028 A / KCTC 5666 / FDC 338) TaxID=203275 RepID=G8UPD6_TANFA|nr:hypothetical protein BFO_2971 [Tannerella forsythia 92A2]BAR50040.1 hypothetical protein TF3313_2611 [Tannerella forsythia 3313]BAR52869.1 hypothetical protein TFKS16_2691 [Tannerella forsythia KS16]
MADLLSNESDGFIFNSESLHAEKDRRNEMKQIIFFIAD